MSHSTISFFLLIFFILISTSSYSESKIIEKLPENETFNPTILQSNLKKHVVYLSQTIGERNLDSVGSLEISLQYIEQQLFGLPYQIRRETFQVNSIEVSNLIAELPGTQFPEKILIIGAHYDSLYDTVGANDNATGVAALIEIAKAMALKLHPYTLKIIALVNEEPPYYKTDVMGSYVSAKNSAQSKEDIIGMISIETIGSYFDEPGSQEFPGNLAQYYPDKGNFIAFISQADSASFLKQAVQGFELSSDFPIEQLAPIKNIKGISWSDHWSYWQFGYKALMITDTALFRYPHYHETTDTLNKINFLRMTQVVEGLIGMTHKLLTNESK